MQTPSDPIAQLIDKLNSGWKAIARRQRQKRPISEWFDPKTGTGRLRRPNGEANSRSVPKVD
jgi:hypothetical protein